LFAKLRPQESVSEADVSKGLSMLLIDGMCAQLMAVFTSGAFLVAFALLLGASNTIIGLLAALGPFAQILQIPSVFLIERVRMRKMLAVVSALVGRAFWLLVAALPWFLPAGSRIPLFLLSLFLYFAIGAVTGSSWNSWMRDFIPEKILGSYFARRMAISIALGAVFSILAGFGVDFYKSRFPDTEVGAYTILFVAGAFFGLLGLNFLARVPEPRMPVSGAAKGIFAVLAQPFRNRNFRQLLFFLGTWSFAINLAAPFFVVYMLKRLGLTMAWVLGLSVVSQMVNVLFLRLWGRLADRFTNKSVLAVSGPFFMVCILLWVFTTMPEKYFLTIPLLFIIHAFTGMSTAGINIAAGNMALKAAPKGGATIYLATNALVSGIAATIAPILGGLAADWFASQEIAITFEWTNIATTGREFRLLALSLRGLDFLFIGSFIFGLYALHRLGPVMEKGEVEEEIVKTQLYTEVRQAVRHVSNVAGIRHLTTFPFAVLRSAVTRFQRSRNNSN
jgi:MFS family permease